MKSFFNSLIGNQPSNPDTTGPVFSNNLNLQGTTGSALGRSPATAAGLSNTVSSSLGNLQSITGSAEAALQASTQQALSVLPGIVNTILQQNLPYTQAGLDALTQQSTLLGLPVPQGGYANYVQQMGQLAQFNSDKQKTQQLMQQRQSEYQSALQTGETPVNQMNKSQVTTALGQLKNSSLLKASLKNHSITLNNQTGETITENLAKQDPLAANLYTEFLGNNSQNQLLMKNGSVKSSGNGFQFLSTNSEGYITPTNVKIPYTTSADGKLQLSTNMTNLLSSIQQYNELVYRQHQLNNNGADVSSKYAPPDLGSMPFYDAAGLTPSWSEPGITLKQLAGQYGVSTADFLKDYAVDSTNQSLSKRFTTDASGRITTVQSQSNQNLLSDSQEWLSQVPDQFKGVASQFDQDLQSKLQEYQGLQQQKLDNQNSNLPYQNETKFRNDLNSLKSRIDTAIANNKTINTSDLYKQAYNLQQYLTNHPDAQMRNKYASALDSIIHQLPKISGTNNQSGITIVNTPEQLKQMQEWQRTGGAPGVKGIMTAYTSNPYSIGDPLYQNVASRVPTFDPTLGQSFEDYLASIQAPTVEAQQAAAAANSQQGATGTPVPGYTSPTGNVVTGTTPGYSDPTVAMQNALQALTQTPGYQFSLGQGLEAIQRSAAAKGNLMSGKTLMAMQQFGQNMAQQTYQQALANLQPAIQGGQQATAANNQAQQNYGQLLTNLLGQQGTTQAGLLQNLVNQAGNLTNTQLGVLGQLNAPLGSTQRPSTAP